MAQYTNDIFTPGPQGQDHDLDTIPIHDSNFTFDDETQCAVVDGKNSLVLEKPLSEFEASSSSAAKPSNLLSPLGRRREERHTRSFTDICESRLKLDRYSAAVKEKLLNDFEAFVTLIAPEMDKMAQAYVLQDIENRPLAEQLDHIISTIVDVQTSQIFTYLKACTTFSSSLITNSGFRQLLLVCVNETSTNTEMLAAVEQFLLRLTAHAVLSQDQSQFFAELLQLEGFHGDLLAILKENARRMAVERDLVPTEKFITIYTKVGTASSLVLKMCLTSTIAIPLLDTFDTTLYLFAPRLTTRELQ